MPGGCAIVGCRNRFIRGGKHFYRFPKDEQFKNLWIQFTRKGNFEVKKCSAICEDHFAADRVVEKKKGRLYLLKKTVPTIYYRESRKGLEKVEVEFDNERCAYVGQESVNLLRGTKSAQEEKLLMQDRRKKAEDLKNLCRFCFESQNEKFVAIKKLEAYSINPTDMIELLDVSPQYNEVFSEIVCEQCIQQIVTIDSFRKKCRKAQDEFVAEMREIDQKLQLIRNFKSEDQKSWFKYDSMLEPDPEEHHSGQIEIVEEHLDDNISFIGDENDEDFNDHAYDSQDFSDYKMVIQDDNKEFLIIKEEILLKNEPIEIIANNSSLEPQFEIMNEDEDDDGEDYEGMINTSNKTLYDINDVDNIIKNPEQNSFALRIYECFFCRLKFAGKKTFKSHECSIKEVKCEVDGCDKVFNKLSGYNTHVVKVHGLLKTSRHFCPICKNVFMSTENQFKNHCRQCCKESEKKDFDNPIECEICKKKCPNLKSYTVHKLFHDSRNLISGNEKNASSLLMKGPVICELCGKEFTNVQGLRTHRKNVHRIGQPKDMVYQCDICSKLRPTKRSLFNHMRNVHRVRETPCNVCGKIFRTPALLQKHMMYHDETKRIHKCPMCPDKPGWFTNVALKRHQRSHHLGLKEHQCDIPFCETSFASSIMLKQHKTNIHGYQV